LSCLDIVHTGTCSFSALTLRMKLRVAGPVKRLNVEHRTSNIEHPILMVLRLIYFETSELQNQPEADTF
jgi:hypothetical protein